MFCPYANHICMLEMCPFFCKELKDCFKALKVKQDLNILTQKEKAGLATVRKEGAKSMAELPK